MGIKFMAAQRGIEVRALSIDTEADWDAHPRRLCSPQTPEGDCWLSRHPRVTNRYLADHNTEPKPFRWKADPDKIIAAASRRHQTLDSIH